MLRRVLIQFAIAVFALCDASAQSVIRSVLGDSTLTHFGNPLSCIGDQDGDGFPELAAGALYGTSTPVTNVISGRTGGVAQVLSGTWKSLGDLQGDGVIDCIARTGNSTGVHASFGSAQLYSLPGSMFDYVMISDVNGDAFNDLLIGGQVRSGVNGQILPYSFSQHPSLSSVYEVGDLNGDGRSEFLVSSSSGYQGFGGVAIYSLLPQGGVQVSQVLPYSSVLGAIGLGDTDGDGFDDFAIARSAGASVFSGASMQEIWIVPTSASVVSGILAAGDLDQDGAQDFWIDQSFNQNPPLPMQRRAVAHSGSDGSVLGIVVRPYGFLLGGVLDVDRDGYPDISLQDSLGPSTTQSRVLVCSGNPTPAVSYCQGKINSLGCEPYVWASGSTSRSGPDNLVVHAANVLNNKLGIMFWGRQGSSAPFLGGTLCISTPFKRTDSQSSGGSSAGSDCSGTFSYAFSQAEMAQNGLGVGSAGYCQFWYRDPGFPSPANVGLTNGVVFTVSF